MELASRISPWRFRIRLMLILAIAMSIPPAIAVLYHFPPDQYTFYPRCIFKLLTGLNCPGCGGTRCLHALVHGDLLQALAFNPLVVLALPYVLVAGTQLVLRDGLGKKASIWRLPSWSISVLFWVVVTFWILRNVDAYPFQLLAPHRLE